MDKIANVYGEALYGLAKDEGLLDEILGQLKALQVGFNENKDYVRLLSTPSLPKAQRTQILEDGFAGKVHPFVLNFMKILTDRGSIGAFSDCCDVYRQHYNRDMGILPVTAITAVALSETQTQRLQEKLRESTGKKIELTNRIDPKCLGGVRLDYDGLQVNATVAHRLETIEKLLTGTVL